MNAAILARQFTNLRTLQRMLRLYETTHGDIENVVHLRLHIADEMKKISKQMYYERYEESQ